MLLLVQSQELEHPQIFADTSSIGVASYEPLLIQRNGGYYLRHYLISGHWNTQDWRAENLPSWVASAIGRPLILAPGYHHIADEDRNKWLEIQKPFAIGSIEDVLYNPKTDAYDAFTKITSDRAIQLIKMGYMPRFVSPAIYGKKIRYENENGKTIRVFEDAEIMHSAIVLKPAFRPIEMATIKDTSCTGEKFLCKKELMAIAEDSAEKLLENNFAYLNRTFEKFNADNNMPNENSNTNHVDTLLAKLQNDLAEAQKAKDLEIEKNKTIAEQLKKEQEEKQALTKERDDAKSKVNTYESEKAKIELRKSFDEKLKKTKMFYSDADLRNKKVDEMVAKNFKVEDLDTIYEGMFMTEDELKQAETKTNTTKEVGIAEDQTKYTSLPTKKLNAEYIKGAAILDDILELRL